MSSKTTVSNDPKASNPSHSQQPSKWQHLSLLIVVFCSGVAVMAMEMTASQLIAPYFGSTISVWTSLIGLVMIFLTTGYYVGGALADRRPSRTMLGGIVLTAGIILLVVPLISTPILMMAWLASPKIGLLSASMLATFILFAIPNILLGCVCPFAMKLSIADLGRTGRASGNIYAISAVGSVIGTFLPALVTIQAFGVRHSVMLFGALLIASALLLLARRHWTFPTLAIVVCVAGVALFSRPLTPRLPTKGMLVERESQYNYIQVIQAGDMRLLFVDWGVFSFYVPGQFRTENYYDYLLLAPLMRPDPPAKWMHRMLIVGLGAGTISKQATEAFGPIAIDGVEIDPAIVDLGRTYFDMNEPNLRIHETDGRTFLAGSTTPYDWVVVDAYQGSEIPTHLVTTEFFKLLRQHMSPNGVLAINLAWWRPDNDEILRRLTTTVRTAFPNVCAVTNIGGSSAVLLAGGNDVSPGRIARNAKLTGHAGLLEIAQTLKNPKGPKVEFPEDLGTPYTDDRAILDTIVDRMYLQTRQERFQRELEALKS